MTTRSDDPLAFEPLSFDLLLPGRIAFGWGRRREFADLARPLGHRALLVTGSRTLRRLGVIDALCHMLVAGGIDVVPFAEIDHEPLVDDVDRATARYHDLCPDKSAGDFMLAIGGGSAIDLAKAVAAMATNADDDSVQAFLEGVGTGRTFTQPPLPIMAVPTTAGTGSEATKNAVISSLDPPFKKSLRFEQLVPRVVLVDPELTASMPSTVTAHTGMDAITQLVESYLTHRATPVTRALALDALVGAPRALRIACGNDVCRETRPLESGHSVPREAIGVSREAIGARETLSRAALTSGITLANSGLGMAHGVAAALGVHCHVPHGLACGVMLPVAMRVNRNACEAELAAITPSLTGQTFDDTATAAAAAIEEIESLCRDIGIPASLGELGVTADQLDMLVGSSRGNSMNGNPRDLSDAELRAILEVML